MVSYCPQYIVSPEEFLNKFYRWLTDNGVIVEIKYNFIWNLQNLLKECFQYTKLFLCNALNFVSINMSENSGLGYKKGVAEQNMSLEFYKFNFPWFTITNSNAECHIYHLEPYRVKKSAWNIFILRGILFLVARGKQGLEVPSVRR